MHELSIALSIIDSAVAELELQGARQATAVHLRLGRLAGVDKEALQFSYGIATQETPLAGSQLVIEDVDVAIFCPACKKECFTSSFPILRCSVCGSLGERVLHGNELEIRAMEIVA